MDRAPYVDIVFGPQTLHRLPDLINKRQTTGYSQVDISFPEIEKFDNLPPARVEGGAAYVSIMEGCSKYCTYCVVPYTRGEEVSRPFQDVLTEVAGLAHQGVQEIHLLGQNVNAYRGQLPDSEETADFAMLLEYVAEIAGIERIRLIHTNDSMDVCGALKDRHQNLGDGEIGLNAFQELINHPAVQNAPLILETPGQEPEHGAEVTLLKKMRNKRK